MLSMQTSTDSAVPANWDLGSPYLRWCSWYGLSSFTYAAVGVLMFSIFNSNFRLGPYPIGIPQELEALCLLVQSVCTLYADVLYLGLQSKWHLVDRLVASAFVVLFLCNTFWISWLELLYFVCVAPTGWALLYQSRQARARNYGITSFTSWHTAWHVFYPGMLVIWLSYRQWAYQDTASDAYA